MKAIAAISAAALLASTGFALAQAPERSAGAGPSGRPGAVLSQAECTKAWQTADVNKKGMITGAEAKDYVSNLKAVDTNNDQKISSDEFTKGCEKGWVQTTALPGGARPAGSDDGAGTGAGAGSNVDSGAAPRQRYTPDSGSKDKEPMTP